MSTDSIGSEIFLSEIWRTVPAIFRACVPETLREPFQFPHVSRLCRNPVTARIFVLTGEAADRGQSRLIPDPEQAWAIYSKFRATERLTLLLNSVEKVDPRLSALQGSFAIPFAWRREDVVCSVSTKGSGIGFHAGREDGFVLQVSGSRRWRVWGSDSVDEAQRRYLLGNDQQEPPAAQRPHIKPIIDCVLEPGDVLYTPAMFAHEGETITESVSLSVAWAGVTAYHVLSALRDVDLIELNAEDERELMVLIPDVINENERVDTTIQFLVERFQFLGERGPSISEIVAYAHRLVGGRAS